MEDDGHVPHGKIVQFATTGVPGRSTRNRIGDHLNKCAECKEAYAQIRADRARPAP